jgi:hypothetical protein
MQHLPGFDSKTVSDGESLVRFVHTNLHVLHVVEDLVEIVVASLPGQLIGHDFLPLACNELCLFFGLGPCGEDACILCLDEIGIAGGIGHGVVAKGHIECLNG